MKLSTGSPLAVFVRTLLPNFSKSTVANQIDVAKNELATKTLPVYVSAYDRNLGFRGRQPFKHPWNKNFNNKLMGQSGIDFKNKKLNNPQNCIELTHDILQTLNNKLTVLENMIDKSFSDEIVNAHLSYLQGNLLRLAEMVEFYLVYSRRVLIYLIHNEYSTVENAVMQDEPYTKGDIKWLENNIVTFTEMTRILSVSDDAFLVAVKNIPDLTISDNADDIDISRVKHADKLDPLRLGFVPYVLNPIYHVRKWWVEWRHNRIEAAKAERELIELRLEQYRLKLAGTDNAKMEQVISATQERLKKLNKKIIEMEESYHADYGA